MDIRSTTEGFRGLYACVTDYFLPPEIASDREAANQARMFLVSHLFGPPMSMSVPAAFYVVDPTPGYDIVVLSLSIAAFLLFPFLMKWGLAYRKLVVLSILNLNFAIFWSCFHYGGVHSPTLIWVIIIPILSVFYIGGDDRQKKELVAVSAASSVVFMGAFFWLRPEPNDIPEAAMEILGATSAVAVMFYVAVMAIYYARIFDAGVDLEREVARRRLISIELRRAVEAADRAASMKSDFLARMSHELRSPLNAIIGYGELLREECAEVGDDPMQQDLDRILEAGAYLTRLIDSILDLAKIDAGKMTFNPQLHNLREIVDEVLQQQGELIVDKGNLLSVSIEPDVTQVTVDRNRLVQIIGSIVSNAVTATSDGTISIVARATEIRRASAFEVVISDTGCGIPAEVLPVIFETFLIDLEAAEGRYGGTGLALSVTSKLCEAMGGGISAVSTEGEGSAFTLTLPTQPVAGLRSAQSSAVQDAA